MRYYSDLLPSYLDGENIQKHSGVIERSDRYLDGLVELFGLWDKLERPILIKREQLDYDCVNTVTLYVNTPSPITEIIIEGDIEETITPEDTVTTSYENTWTITDPSIPVGSSISLPNLFVTVRTETHTYTKAYPENDTIENNSADHDIFLDIIGGLLGIPRRKYRAWDLELPENTEPPYFAKQYQDGTYLECSEDDYYYKERLEYFIQTTDNIRVFRAIYDKEAVLLNHEDFEIGGIPSGNVLFVHIIRGNPLNDTKINIDTTNIQEIAEQSLPITRQTLVLPYNQLTSYAIVKSEYVNVLEIHLTLGLKYKTIDMETTEELPLINLPVIITYQEDETEVGTWTTDETGTVHIRILGARSGENNLHWGVTREYPYFTLFGISHIISYNASLFKLSLSDGAWQYKKYFNTSVTDFENPTVLDNDNLNCGRGMIAYTPAINPTIVDLTDYTLHVKFHHTTGEQRILLGTLGMPSEETARIYGMNNVPRNYESSNPSITDTHTFTYQFTNGVCSLLFDGVDTGVTYDFSNTTDMIYIAGVNNRENGAIRGLHFEEIRVGDEPTPTPVATSLSVTTVGSTTGSASVKATLTSNGTGISGATIQCKNGTTLLTNGTTDTNGECTLNLSTLQAGNYTLTIEYNGDSTYSATSTTHSITITDPTPVTLNKYGKGQTTGWSTTQWTTIEINAEAEAHCNYTKRNAILKNLPLTGDFTLVLNIQASHNQSWNWGLIPSQSDYSNPAMKVSKGDTLNTNTSIATMFDHGSGVWDTTVEVTITRSGTTYTLEYNGNSYSFTGSTDTLYLWMDKTGSGNLFLTYIETTATMQ